MPDLIRSGYEVLIQAGGDADCFVKKEQSLFLFFQSHPEYQLDTLLLEYRRDVARFLRGESTAYPNVPQGYFDEQTLFRLAEIEVAAAVRPHSETPA
jgi:homoserine O-succinyltransferase